MTCVSRSPRGVCAAVLPDCVCLQSSQCGACLECQPVGPHLAPPLHTPLCVCCCCCRREVLEDFVGSGLHVVLPRSAVADRSCRALLHGICKCLNAQLAALVTGLAASRQPQSSWLGHMRCACSLLLNLLSAWRDVYGLALYRAYSTARQPNIFTMHDVLGAMQQGVEEAKRRIDAKQAAGAAGAGLDCTPPWLATLLSVCTEGMEVRGAGCGSARRVAPPCSAACTVLQRLARRRACAFRGPSLLKAVPCPRACCRWPLWLMATSAAEPRCCSPACKPCCGTRSCKRRSR